MHDIRLEKHTSKVEAEQYQAASLSENKHVKREHVEIVIQIPDPYQLASDIRKSLAYRITCFGIKPDSLLRSQAFTFTSFSTMLAMSPCLLLNCGRGLRSMTHYQG